MHGDGAVSDYRELLVVRGIRRPPPERTALAASMFRPLPGVVGGSAARRAGSAVPLGLVAALVAYFAVFGLALRRRSAG